MYLAARRPNRPVVVLEPVSETEFDRADVPDISWTSLRSTAEAWVNACGLEDVTYEERLRHGDKWYPYLLASSDKGKVRVCGWNEMVEIWSEGKWETIVPPQHPGAHWHGGGSTFYFADGTFKFQTHGHKERKGSEDYPVIEDMAGDKAQKLFPDRYVRLSDGREGISTEGLSPGDLKVIMRDMELKPYERGERYAHVGKGAIQERKAVVRRKLVDMGCNPDLGWDTI